MSSLSKTMRRGNFWPLFTTQALGALNDNIFRTALTTYIVFQLPTMSETTKGILSPLALALMMLPFFLFSSVAGELADRFRKSTLVKILKTTELGVMIFGALGFIWGNPYFLLLIIFLMGTQSTFFGPIKYSYLPEILPEDELIGGNGLFEGVTFVTIVVGCLIGGFLAGIAPYKSLPLGNYLVAGVVVIVASLGLWSASKLPDSRLGDQTIKPNPKIWQSTYQIIKNARDNTSIWLCILGLSWFWLMGGIFISQLPLFVERVLNGTPAVYNLLLVNFSIGVGIGSLSCQWILKGRISTFYVPWAAIAIAILMIDFSILIFGMKPNLETKMTLGIFFSSFSNWHLFINLFLISFFAGFYVVPQNTLLQYLSPPEQCSRMIAANNIINSLFMSLSSIAAMVFLGLGGNIKYVFASLAVGSIIVAFVALFLLPEHIARLICSFFLRIFYKVKVTGYENVANIQGPAFLIANHTSFLDAVLLVGFIPRKVTFAVNSQWAAKWWLRLIARFIKALPIDPTNPMSARILIDDLNKGGLVALFPEGRITTTGAIMKIYDGAAMIVDKAKAPVICASIRGAQYSLFGRFGKKLKKRPHKNISLHFSEPTKVEIPENLTGRMRRHRINDEIYRLMIQTNFDGAPHNIDLWSSFKNSMKEQGKKRQILYDISYKPLTYGRIFSQAKVLAYHISKTTEEKERIGVLMPNVNASVILFLAIVAAGRIPVMLNYSQGSGPLSIAVKTASVKRIYTSKEFLETAKIHENELPVKAIYLEELKINAFKRIRGLFYEGVKVSPEDPAVILFTSGSEGHPKGVVLSHSNVLSNIYQLLCVADFNEKDTLFNALPIFHALGLVSGTILPLISGSKLFLYPNPLHAHMVAEMIYDNEATVIISTDTFLRTWGKAANPYDFHSVSYIFAGGEKLKDQTIELFCDKFGRKIYEGYGVTEASPVIAINTAMRNRKGTVGRFLERTSYRLEKVDNLVAKDDNAVGLLYVKAPNIMKGYIDADNPDKIKAPKDGWYNTGDIVSIDNDGYVTIIGRQKRFAKIGGEMVSLEAIEVISDNVWGGIKHAVISLSDEEHGEILALVSEQEVDLKELWNELKNKGYSEVFYPKKVIIIKNIPITPLGKVDYMKLQKMILVK